MHCVPPHQQCANLRRAGWEDLIDEASEDLEQLEGRVRAATQRLLELQAQATSATEAVVAQEEARALAEQQAQHAQAVVEVGSRGWKGHGGGRGLGW